LISPNNPPTTGSVSLAWQVRYSDDPEFSLKARCLAALAFLPPQDVVAGFERLTHADDYPDELDAVVDYFESVYIGNIGRGSRRRRPTFPHSLWSQYHRVLNDLPRTTNSLEGWHNALKGVLLNVAHPSMPAFVTKIRLEESSAAHRIERIVAGHPPQHKRKKYQDVDDRIKSIVTSYTPTNIIQYLRSISHNISF